MLAATIWAISRCCRLLEIWKIRRIACQILNLVITIRLRWRAFIKPNFKTVFYAEVTATKRTGFAQLTYPSAEKTATIIIGSGINATQLLEAEIKFKGNNTLEGFADGGSFCSPQIKTNYRVYFVAAFDAKPISSGTWKGKNLQKTSTQTNGENSGAYLSFDVSHHKVIHYKFAISYVSMENARQNLKAENPDWDFNQVKTASIATWNKYLGKIAVSGGTQDHTTQFYTHLYHALAHPSLFSDVNGQYIGGDHQKHQSKTAYYTAFSNWDTYRTQGQLLSLIAPKETGDMMTSLIDFAQKSGGGFPALGNGRCRKRVLCKATQPVFWWPMLMLSGRKILM